MNTTAQRFSPIFQARGPAQLERRPFQPTPTPPSVRRRLPAPGDPLPTYPNQRGPAYPTQELGSHYTT